MFALLQNIDEGLSDKLARAMVEGITRVVAVRKVCSFGMTLCWLSFSLLLLPHCDEWQGNPVSDTEATVRAANNKGDKLCKEELKVPSSFNGTAETSPQMPRASSWGHFVTFDDHGYVVLSVSQPHSI